MLIKKLKEMVARFPSPYGGFVFLIIFGDVENLEISFPSPYGGFVFLIGNIKRLEITPKEFPSPYGGFVFLIPSPKARYSKGLILQFAAQKHI